MRVSVGSLLPPSNTRRFPQRKIQYLPLVHVEYTKPLSFFLVLAKECDFSRTHAQASHLMNNSYFSHM